MTLLSCITADRNVLATIYEQILGSHLENFDNTINGLTKKIVTATADLYLKIADDPKFYPTAKKFHYQFNLRDFARII